MLKKPSHRALFFSLAVFPGAGLWAIGEKVRALIFIIPSALACILMVGRIMSITQDITQRMVDEFIPLTISNFVNLFLDIRQQIYADSIIREYLLFLLIAWLLSGLSSYFAGKKKESEQYIMQATLIAIGLLFCSNIFMTFAWYAHLKELNHKPWIVAAFVSWGIALFEYLLQVPANRIGYTVMSVGQLKILQEVITLSVFVPFALFYLKEPLKWDYLWAGLCLLGAVYFMFRDKLAA